MRLVELAHLFVTLVRKRKRLRSDVPELTVDRRVRLLEAERDEFQLRLARAIAQVDYHLRRDEVARRSHAKTRRVRHRGIKFLRL